MVKFTDVEAAHQKKESKEWSSSTDDDFYTWGGPKNFFAVGPGITVSDWCPHLTPLTGPTESDSGNCIDQGRINIGLHRTLFTLQDPKLNETNLGVNGKCNIIRMASSLLRLTLLLMQDSGLLLLGRPSVSESSSA